MTSRRQFLAIILALFALPVVAAAQGPYGAMPPPTPPIPTGPPLAPPPADVRRTTWVEDAGGVIPATGTMTGTATFQGNDASWPVTRTGSACSFDGPEPSPEWWMLAEPTSVQVLMGAYFSSTLGPSVPHFNYLPVTFRQTWNMGNPLGSLNLFPSYWEFVADVTGSPIVTSYGNYFAGPSFYWRTNWADPGSAIIPYSQAGVGGIINDAYKNQNQRAIGEMFEFYLHCEVGVKFRIAPNLSLDIEGGLQHISNGSLAARNLGINAFGGSIGFTYYFPCSAH